ncbi:hypothetical protein [Nocardia otitidiscaviarum]|uniref:hypothetical protein n=1 Tax=Nocardia otitidiscaviarum TaxID=1823 RepID=UPI0011C07CC8|nr:hypothetical protein [Nocardia otitidiscaviarum]
MSDRRGRRISGRSRPARSRARTGSPPPDTSPPGANNDITDPTTLLATAQLMTPTAPTATTNSPATPTASRTTAVDDATRHAQHDAEQERQRELDRQRQRELDQQRQHYRPTTPDHPTGLEP